MGYLVNRKTGESVYVSKKPKMGYKSGKGNGYFALGAHFCEANWYYISSLKSRDGKPKDTPPPSSLRTPSSDFDRDQSAEEGINVDDYIASEGINLDDWAEEELELTELQGVEDETGKPIVYDQSDAARRLEAGQKGYFTSSGTPCTDVNGNLYEDLTPDQFRECMELMGEAQDFWTLEDLFETQFLGNRGVLAPIGWRIDSPRTARMWELCPLTYRRYMLCYLSNLPTNTMDMRDWQSTSYTGGISIGAGVSIPWTGVGVSAGLGSGRHYGYIPRVAEIGYMLVPIRPLASFGKFHEWEKPYFTAYKNAFVYSIASHLPYIRNQDQFGYHMSPYYYQLGFNSRARPIYTKESIIGVPWAIDNLLIDGLFKDMLFQIIDNFEEVLHGYNLRFMMLNPVYPVKKLVESTDSDGTSLDQFCYYMFALDTLWVSPFSTVMSLWDRIFNRGGFHEFDINGFSELPKEFWYGSFDQEFVGRVTFTVDTKDPILMPLDEQIELLKEAFSGVSDFILDPDIKKERAFCSMVVGRIYKLIARLNSWVQCKRFERNSSYYQRNKRFPELRSSWVVESFHNNSQKFFRDQGIRIQYIGKDRDLIKPNFNLDSNYFTIVGYDGSQKPPYVWTYVKDETIVIIDDYYLNSDSCQSYRIFLNSYLQLHNWIVYLENNWLIDNNVKTLFDSILSGNGTFWAQVHDWMIPDWNREPWTAEAPPELGPDEVYDQTPPDGEPPGTPGEYTPPDSGDLGHGHIVSTEDEGAPK